MQQYHADKLRPVLAARRVISPARLASTLRQRDYQGELRTVAEPDRPDPLDALVAHMGRNARLAIAAARWLSETFDDVTIVDDPVRVLLDLPPLPGRLRPLRSAVDDHRWYDDALASNPSGAAAAVESFSGQPMWLIVGGIDRGVDLSPLIDAVAAASSPGPVSVVAVPDNGPDIVARFAGRWGRPGPERICRRRVASAVGLIRQRATEPSVVLFSPAAPTPPQHGNWSNRSQAFADAVAGEPQPMRSMTH